MAIRNAISADSQSLYRASAAEGTPTTVIDGGSRWFELQDGSTPDQLTFPSADGLALSTARVGYGFTVKFLDWNIGAQWAFAGETTTCTLRIDNTNQNLLVYNPSGQLIQTITAPFSLNTEYQIEVSMVLATTATGEIEVFIDDVGQGNQTGVLTLAAASTLKSVTLAAFNNTTGGSMRVKDVYLFDNSSRQGVWEVAGLNPGATSPTTGGTTPDSGTFLNASEIPPSDANFMQYDGAAAEKSGWIQDDGSGSLSGPSGRGFANDPDGYFGTWRAQRIDPASSETLIPNSLITQTNLSGTLADIDEGTTSPDANWLTATGGGATVCRVGFPTPAIPIHPINASTLRAVVRSDGTGGTELRVANGTITQTGFTGALTLIDEDADSPTNDWMTNASTSAELHVNMENPSGGLDTSTDAQTIKLYARKDATGGGTPTFTIEVYDNGSFHELLASGVSVDTTGTLFTYNWTAAGLSSPDNVEVRITASSDGGGPNRRYVEIDALNWDAVVSGATLNGTIQLYEAGTAKTPSQNFTVSPSDGEKLITLDFDGADLTDASGADLECRVWQTDSSPTEFIEIGAIDAVTTNSVGSTGFNLQLGNSVDGMANVRLVSVGTSIAQYDSGTGLADVIPLKTEFGRWGIGKQANSYHDIKVYECFQDVIFDPTAAGRAVTCTTEALATTPAGATVSRGRSVTCGTEALATTPAACTVERGRSVQCATVALALAPAAATVLRGRAVTAATEALATTPNPTTVLRGGARNVDCTTEALQTAPGAATVERGRAVACATQALTSSPASATVERGRSVVCPSATLATAPSATTVERGREVAAGTQALATTPGAASVERGRSATATTAALATTPNPAQVTRGAGRFVTCPTAQLATAPAAATVSRGREVTTPTEALSSSPAAATVERGRAVVASSQALATAPNPAQVTRGAGRFVTCAPEALQTAGAAVSVERGREIACSTVALTIAPASVVVGRAREVICATVEIRTAPLAAVVERARQVDAATEALQTAPTPATVVIGREIACPTAQLATAGSAAVERGRDVVCGTVATQLAPAPVTVERAREILAQTVEVRTTPTGAVVVRGREVQALTAQLATVAAGVTVERGLSAGLADIELDGRISTGVILEGRFATSIELEGPMYTSAELTGAIDYE